MKNLVVCYLGCDYNSTCKVFSAISKKAVLELVIKYIEEKDYYVDLQVSGDVMDKYLAISGDGSLLLLTKEEIQNQAEKGVLYDTILKVSEEYEYVVKKKVGFDKTGKKTFGLKKKH